MSSTPTYAMPKPIGAVVLFRHSNSDRPAFAIVTAVNERSIDCSLVGNSARQFLPRNGVRHKADPDLARFVDYSDGIWEECDFDRVVRGLQSDVFSLGALLASLTNQIESLVKSYDEKFSDLEATVNMLIADASKK